MNGEPLTSIDIALNEANWLGVAVDAQACSVRLGFDVLTLPDGPDGDGHEVVRVVLSSVGRIVASLRRGRWDNERAEIVPLDLAGLATIVESFGGSPIYGWDFLDLPEASWERWRRRLSLDEEWPGGSRAHNINLFQEGRQDGQDRHLDVRIWFGELAVNDASGRQISLPEFARGGRRWWDGLRSGDERVKGFGIVPGRA